MSVINACMHQNVWLWASIGGSPELDPIHTISIRISRCRSDLFCSNIEEFFGYHNRKEMEIVWRDPTLIRIVQHREPHVPFLVVSAVKFPFGPMIIFPDSRCFLLWSHRFGFVCVSNIICFSSLVGSLIVLCVYYVFAR